MVMSSYEKVTKALPVKWILQSIVVLSEDKQLYLVLGLPSLLKLPLLVIWQHGRLLNQWWYGVRP